MSTMRWMTWGLAGLGLLALAAPVLADAQGLEANRTAKFRELDRDGNGSLDRGEYGGHPGNFRALDQNKDGVLSLDEFVDRSGVRPQEEPRTIRGIAGEPVPENLDLFSAKDHDRNGVVDRAEWPDNAEFNRRDTNRDNVVTRDEFFAGEPRDPRSQRFDRMDRNRDGVLSRNEWKGGTRTFERTDANRDGVISREEYLR